MATLDPSIILQGARDNGGVDIAGAYNTASQIQQHRMGIQQSQEAMRQKQILEEGYRQSVGPDGQIDQNRLMSFMAQNGGGQAVPGMQKFALENQKTQGEIRNKNVDTDAKQAETLYKGMKEMDGAISSLLANPNVDDRMVYGEMGRLVRMGVFDMQAKHQGVNSDEMAKQFLSTMPVGNPSALRDWLVQNGMRAADASKRLEVALPKYDEQDRGGVLNSGTINQMTGQRTAGVGPTNNVVKSNTPDAVLKSRTDLNIAGMVDARARETNDINREASQSQIIEGPQGQMVVNKDTTLARPIATINGQPLLGKDSESAKDSRRAGTLSGQITEARQILPNATGSWVGAQIDKALGSAGMSTKSGDAAAKLETIGAWMTTNVPRFEGPQSNNDVETYKTMAGDVANRNLPVSQRLAKLEALERFVEDRIGKPGTGPAAMVVPAPPPAGSGPRLATPRGGSYTGRTPIGSRPGQQPDINSFFKQP